ncbi:MAG: fluoride efflux transporter CrcB [Oscillospiraceae bacterium]|nr:fluoride efflux transporter CrcB [Oscillospiraceae bacterium]
MQKIIYVGLGGCIGAVVRYLVSSKISGAQIPLGTLFVNVLGGFLIGVIMEMCISTEFIPPNLRLFLTTGVLGGLTTFSTFSYETVRLFGEGKLKFAIINIFLNLLLCLGGVLLGQYMTAKLI